jgi:hypothetical protein
VQREAARPYEFVEVREELKRLYEQERFSKNYESYVADLRKQFQVDVRI